MALQTSATRNTINHRSTTYASSTENISRLLEGSMRASPKSSTAIFLEEKMQKGTTNLMDDHENQFPCEHVQGSWEEDQSKTINGDDDHGFLVHPKESEKNVSCDHDVQEDGDGVDDDHKNATPPLTFIEKWLLEETSTGVQMEEMSHLMELSNMLLWRGFEFVRRGGLSRAAPRNQSRRGFLKPLILPSLLFFEMEETVFIEIGTFKSYKAILTCINVVTSNAILSQVINSLEASNDTKLQTPAMMIDDNLDFNLFVSDSQGRGHQEYFYSPILAALLLDPWNRATTAEASSRIPVGFGVVVGFSYELKQSDMWPQDILIYLEN
ncbi:hypothetical protein F2Q69_00026115 [Brassica cretica]|uniref:Uncharacterized protein n=1 Tax=Brassica cretica TaxID=69181 RepID=A0A8S9S8Y3_BRACR|nr:hypothetical protein F2Q69_00026115 [Brassica cretica]